MSNVIAKSGVRGAGISHRLWCVAAGAGMLVAGGLAYAQSFGTPLVRSGSDPGFGLPATEAPEVATLKVQVHGLEATIAQLESRVAALEAATRADMWQGKPAALPNLAGRGGIAAPLIDRGARDGSAEIMNKGASVGACDQPRREPANDSPR